MASIVIFTAGCVAGALGVGVLRASWSRPRRSAALNTSGWLLMLGGATCGWLASGAWAVAITSLFTMTMACILLAIAAWGSAPSKLKASNRRVGLLPEAGEPLRIGGRVITFGLVGLLAAAIGLGMAVALSALLLLAGMHEANAYALALQLMPVFWAAVAFAVLMQPSRRGQIKVLAIASVPAWPALLAGAV